VNREHFRAFLWLRWRLRVNQVRRGGVANAVLLAILGVGVVALAAILFVTFFLIGLFALRAASPAAVLYVWDGLVAAFLFCWVIGLLADLQRSEPLSLDKFLHLPVSLTGAFLINYVSSLFSVTLIIFLPPLLALSLALVFAKGPAMLLALPLLAAFLFLVTALTYQFQGWLGSLMANPRRRRTVIVLVTFGFILVCQLPNLVNLLRPWEDRSPTGFAARDAEEQAELRQSLAAGEITVEEFQRRLNAQHQAQQARAVEARRQTWEQVERTTRLVNLVVPPGWLPLGAAAAAEGAVLPALLGTVGLTLLGTASLWRAYRTTLRLYTGQFSGGKQPAAAPAPPVPAGKPSTGLLERELPWLSEQAAAVALSSFGSLGRAPEAKMLCLGPVILAVLFGGMLVAQRVDVPVPLRPLLPFGAMGLVLVCMVQLMGNQFGFDRNGFRSYVLSPARRRDILLGKNLAYAPLVLGMGLALAVLLQAISPMRLDYFLATGPQLIAMYLLFCLLGNVVSVLGPMPIAPGTLKPVNAKLVPVLLQVALFFVLPLVLAPLLLPQGVQLALEALGWTAHLPVALVLSLAECAAVVLVYRVVLGWEGQLLQAREQAILGIVTVKD
jgi:hypothetical protein